MGIKSIEEYCKTIEVIHDIKAKNRTMTPKDHTLICIDLLLSNTACFRCQIQSRELWITPNEINAFNNKHVSVFILYKKVIIRGIINFLLLFSFNAARY